MTIEEAKARVEEIRAVADDDEKAHGMEDDLREDVLRHIAENPGAEDVSELARIALSTSEIEFARWCA